MKKKVKKVVKSLNDFNQTHGKEEVFNLDDITGEFVNKYSQASTEDYEAYISDMTTTDLKKHAQEIGLVPIDNIEILRKRLIVEFNKYFNSRKRTSTFKSNKASTREINKILAEGR